ncbi:hypothetical protein GCM10023223_42910 [Stackebrandtia albiflava]
MRVHGVRLGRAEYRVVRADPVPARLALRDDHHWLSMYADRAGAERLLAMWALAARSARSLVYLPIRAGAVPRDTPDGVDSTALDLVLVHHRLQFPVSSWKRLRARLGAGELRTATTPAHDPRVPDDLDHARRDHREYRDHLRFAVAAHTLFVIGGARAFRASGAALRGLVEEGPSYLHEYPNASHYCVELRAGPWSRPWTDRRTPAALHIQYRPPGH